MSEKLLIPSVENRLSSFVEYNRRIDLEKTTAAKREAQRKTVTISREFGCEAYSVANALCEMLKKKSGEEWVVMDKELLDEVAKNHNLSEKVMQTLGEKNRMLDEFLATFSRHWKSEKDYFRLLSKQIFALAEQGNVILLGRGSAIITKSLENCYHFRIYASLPFKIKSISKRLGISPDEAEKLIATRQKQRDNFIRDFLDKDAHDQSYYHLVFNNDKNSAEKMAGTIFGYMGCDVASPHQ